MFGADLRAAKDRKIQKELDQKRVAREYMRYATSRGMTPGDAMRFAPTDVKDGISLIRREEKKVAMDDLHRQKERMANQFKIQTQGRTT